jgi:hypothetical protein
MQLVGHPQEKWYLGTLNCSKLTLTVVPHELQLSPAENQLGIALLKILDDLDVITKTFQDQDLHIFMIRDYLDCAISVYSELEQHCGPTSQIVEDQEFESAVVKIQQWQTGWEMFALTKKEK